MKLSGDSSLREYLRKKLDADVADNVIDLLPSPYNKSEHWALIFQILFLFRGLVLIMLVAAKVLLRV